MPSRTNLSRVTVILAGTNLGVWDDRTGGDQGSSSVQYQLGGGGPRISLGGAVQVANVVCQKLQDDTLLAQRKFILSQVGRGAIQASQQELDDEFNPVGEPLVWTGRLIRAKPPEAQSQTAAAAIFEIEMEVSGMIG